MTSEYNSNSYEPIGNSLTGQAYAKQPLGNIAGQELQQPQATAVYKDFISQTIEHSTDSMQLLKWRKLIDNKITELHIAAEEAFNQINPNPEPKDEILVYPKAGVVGCECTYCMSPSTFLLTMRKRALDAGYSEEFVNAWMPKQLEPSSLHTREMEHKHRRQVCMR